MNNDLENKEIKINELPDQPLIHEFKEEKTSLNNKKIIVWVIVIILTGGLTGFVLSRSVGNKAGSSSVINVSSNNTQGAKVVGSADTKTFPDSTEGTLEADGAGGEGTHKLIRPGGDSQTVYLTSSVVDLNQFVGKKVKVWGQTFAAKKAGWFMDVGKVELME